MVGGANMSYLDQQSCRLPWEGCLNVRDLGGYPTASGGLIRMQALIRSDSLHRLTPQGMAAIYDYGVRTIIDLRLAHELELNPSPFSTQEVGSVPRYLNLPMHDMATDALIGAVDSTVAVYIIILDRSKFYISSIVKAVAKGLQEGGVLIN